VRGEPFEINSPAVDATAAQVVRIDEDSDRRWYPVIDYSRCTNCMECIDFCLFGVYGVDKVETILVEQPDNCRKGCPACSRVCPENAIIFPQHKTPTIAGSPVVAGSLKIDLSKLFGAPETGESAEQAAIRERDEQLLLAGRAAVGDSVGLPKRHEHKPAEPKDELDSLIDALDNF
jgi:MinD superfamily P-loop ATPase